MSAAAAIGSLTSSGGESGESYSKTAYSVAAPTPQWMLGVGAVSQLARTAGGPALLRTLGRGNDFAIVAANQPSRNPMPGAAAVQSFTSYQGMEQAFATSGVAPPTRAILYDIEVWSFTPLVEQENPVGYTMAAAQLAHVRPSVQVFAGLSTNPLGRPVSASAMVADIRAVMGEVDGFWLNIPLRSPYCPSCGSGRPDIAVQVLQQVL
jgi:hypothetical protein